VEVGGFWLPQAKVSDPHLKNNQAKRVGDVTQVVEHLSSKPKALSLKPRTNKIQTKTKKFSA
jgi:hypothetical protein